MESKIIFGQMINYYRKLNNLSMEEFGNKIGKTKSTISKWESSNRYPKIEEVEAIAKFFDVSVETLLFGSNSNRDDLIKIYDDLQAPRQTKVYNFAERQLEEQNRSNVVDMNDYIEEKMSGYLSAGTGEYLSENIEEEIRIPKSIVPDASYDLILQVNGDSMEPMFEDHEYIFVKKTTDIRSGQIGVFIIDNESYLKKAYIEDNHLRLVSLNTKYEDLIFDDVNEITVVGTVVM